MKESQFIKLIRESVSQVLDETDVAVLILLKESAEKEPYDDETDEFQPSPRERTELSTSEKEKKKQEISELLRKIARKIVQETLFEGFDPMSAGPRPEATEGSQENPYPAFNDEMRKMEEESEQLENEKMSWNDIVELCNGTIFDTPYGKLDMWTLMGVEGLKMEDAENNTPKFFKFIISHTPYAIKQARQSGESLSLADTNTIKRDWEAARKEEKNFNNTQPKNCKSCGKTFTPKNGEGICPTCVTSTHIQEIVSKNPLELTLVGEDDFSRPLYKDKNGKFYVDVNLGRGTLSIHSVTDDGEPEYPVKNFVIQHVPLQKTSPIELTSTGKSDKYDRPIFTDKNGKIYLDVHQGKANNPLLIALDDEGDFEGDFLPKNSYTFSNAMNETDTSAEDPRDAFYVEYVGQMANEVPFILKTPSGNEKFEYVKAKYPDGKVDIGVYAFRGDMVYGYNAFRKMMNIS